jgi:hypothetical protein
MKEIEKEIVIVRNMIDVLNRCLLLSISRARIRESMTIKKDIRTCKNELNRLIEAKNEPKEKEKDGAFQ